MGCQSQNYLSFESINSCKKVHLTPLDVSSAGHLHRITIADLEKLSLKYNKLNRQTFFQVQTNKMLMFIEDNFYEKVYLQNVTNLRGSDHYLCFHRRAVPLIQLCIHKQYHYHLPQKHCLQALLQCGLFSVKNQAK